MAKLAYVVHRYAPNPGGSEYYVQAMAEESVRRGHDVTVVTSHSGDLNGVRVTNDASIFWRERFDLVIIHGADVHVQNWVISHAKEIQVQSPILYLLILPSWSDTARYGMEHCAYLGVSTQADWSHLSVAGYQGKAVSVRHSIPAPISDTYRMKTGIFKQKHKIDTRYMFLSCGGFWPNKGMQELVDTFLKFDGDDVSLVLTGYANYESAPKTDDDRVRVIMLDDRSEVMQAIADADLYILNSTQEGFGLVLLEAMLNKTPWAGRHIAGAIELQAYGDTYQTQEELLSIMNSSSYHYSRNRQKLEIGANYVLDERLIGNTVNDIEAVLRKCAR